MRFLTSSQIRTWDQRAIAERGVCGLSLMNRAGAAVARVVARVAAQGREQNVWLIAGRGNNGGDAFVAARCLHEDGFAVRVRMTCAPDALRGDARGAWEQMQQAGVPFRVWAEVSAWLADEGEDQPCGGVIVDGLLGTGSEGLPHGVVAAAIHWITRARGRCRVVAIDIPSGLNADTGDSGDPVVRADVTVSLAAPKTGFRNPKAWEWIGHVEIVDIGLPLDLQPEPEAGDGGQFIGAPELAPLLAPRGRGTHKGHYGHVLVIGGSHGLSGAPALAAMGALRSGAGLVSAAVPEICLPWMAALAPSAMAHPIRCERGAMTATTLVAGIRPVSAFDVVVAGPGLSVGEGTARMVEELLRGSSSRLVLDADALNVLDGRVAQLRRTAAAPSVIITPHPGEAARLLGVTSAVIQANRNASAQELAARSQAVVVLKGAGTLVATPAGARHLNLTGNPGMASGGTGDVLAGLIAGLWAQGLSPLDAARLAVYLHGTAGDLGVWPLGERALVADDLGHWLGPACRWLEAMG